MIANTAIRDQIAAGAAAMSVELAASQLDLLALYVAELQKWNAFYNLTAIRDARDMVTKHMLDSLGVLPFIVGDSLLDVGAGAGLPSVPTAIVRPDVAVTSLDSNGKKTRFLTHIKSQLDLDNLTVAHARIEQFAPPALFSTITSRAFASLHSFVTQCEGLCRDDGEIVVMLGKAPSSADIERLGERLIQIEPITVPGLLGERHIARVRPAITESTNG